MYVARTVPLFDRRVYPAGGVDAVTFFAGGSIEDTNLPTGSLSHGQAFLARGLYMCPVLPHDAVAKKKVHDAVEAIRQAATVSLEFNGQLVIHPIPARCVLANLDLSADEEEDIRNAPTGYTNLDGRPLWRSKDGALSPMRDYSPKRITQLRDEYDITCVGDPYEFEPGSQPRLVLRLRTPPPRVEVDVSLRAFIVGYMLLGLRY